MALEKLGPYQMRSVLGRGGMGTVYKAEHDETNELFAVKVLAPVYSHDPHFRNRFESEIKALYKLDHPNIVRLFSYGQDDLNLFFAMELVDGKSLFQLQRDGAQFCWREVIQITKDVAKGLRHAHDRGIIHRDLKPGNLLRDKNGTIKITDFGIAKSFGMSQNTGTNVLGTIDFMSPEQGKGQPVTVRSDLYSLGTVMFTLLSGSPPFTGNSVEESLRNLTKVPAPRIMHRVPDVPVELDELIGELLQKDPEKRIPTAQALLHRLESIEKKLRDHSEAQTVEGPPVVANQNTIDDKPPDQSQVPIGTSGSAKSIENFEGKKQKTEDSKSRRGTTFHVERKHGESGDEHGRIIRPQSEYPPIEKQDYFNTVTDGQRRQQSLAPESYPATNLKSVLAVALPLIAVIGLVGFGIYQVTRPPTAEALLAEIELYQHTPQKRLAEIDQFIDRFPDHKKLSMVQNLRGIAVGNQLVNRLKAAANSSRGLSAIQQQLLGIVEQKKTNSPDAFEQLSALIMLHEGDGDLAEFDIQAIDAAKSFMPMFKIAADQEMAAARQKINDALSRADANPEKSLEIYESIVKLYSGVSWARDLVDEAQRKIDTPTRRADPREDN